MTGKLNGTFAPLEDEDRADVEEDLEQETVGTVVSSIGGLAKKDAATSRGGLLGLTRCASTQMWWGVGNAGNV
jgi:hypothetical protein